MNAAIISLVMPFLIYFAISQLYFKRKLRIKPKSTFMFHQDRKGLWIFIDCVLLVLFIWAMFWVNVEERPEPFSGFVRISPMFALFFLTSLNRGIEEWLTHREDKAYYHEWLGSLLCLAVVTILFLTQP